MARVTANIISKVREYRASANEIQKERVGQLREIESLRGSKYGEEKANEVRNAVHY